MNKPLGVLRLEGLYVVKPYIIPDDENETHKIWFELDLTLDQFEDLNEQLQHFDNGEPISILIYQEIKE